MTKFLDQFKEACDSARAIASHTKEQVIVCSYYVDDERKMEAIPLRELAGWLEQYRRSNMALHYLTPPTL